MIQVTGVAIRSNKRVILPKANWANVPTIFLWWNIISKTFAAWSSVDTPSITASFSSGCTVALLFELFYLSADDGGDDFLVHRF